MFLPPTLQPLLYADIQCHAAVDLLTEGNMSRRLSELAGIPDGARLGPTVGNVGSVFVEREEKCCRMYGPEFIFEVVIKDR